MPVDCDETRSKDALITPRQKRWHTVRWWGLVVVVVTLLTIRNMTSFKYRPNAPPGTTSRPWTPKFTDDELFAEDEEKKIRPVEPISNGFTMAGRAPGVKKIERVDGATLTYEEFLEKYAGPGIPVLISNYSSVLPSQQWSPRRLREQCGDRVLDFSYQYDQVNLTPKSEP